MTASDIDRDGNESPIEMPIALEDDPEAEPSNPLIERAVGLLSQQIWCWGRDIVREEGNWLIEIGFDRIEAPANRNCSSVYSLQLPGGRYVVLRAFGVFFGDPQHGGLFLWRYEFQPLYTADATLERPLWSSEDLPELTLPTRSQRASCMALTLDLIDWLATYEANVADVLGVGYRRSTLASWDNGERFFMPAETFVRAWRDLSPLVASNFDVYLRAQT